MKHVCLFKEGKHSLLLFVNMLTYITIIYSLKQVKRKKEVNCKQSNQFCFPESYKHIVSGR